jgi:hypothetical protein
MKWYENNQNFMKSIEILIEPHNLQVRKNCPNHRIASIIYPLFQSIHSLYSKNKKQELRNNFECDKESKILKFKQETNNKSLNFEEFFKNNESEQVINNFGPNINKNVRKSTKLSFDTTVEKIGNNSYIALKFSLEELKTFEFMIRIITSKIEIFKLKISNCLEPDGFWSVVSNEVIRKGYNKWTPKKCRNSYSNSIDLYKEV